MPKMISGTCLVPGRSRNNREYSAPVIAGAVHRAQERIRSGPPLLMLSSHAAAESDSAREVVGVIRDLQLDAQGRAIYRAELLDTAAGRDVGALIGTENSAVAVSIRGRWGAGYRQERATDGQTVETADELDLEGVDITLRPGIPGASARAVESTARARDPLLVLEEVSVDPAPALTAAELAAMPHEDFRAAGREWLLQRETAGRAAKRAARPSLAQLVADGSGVPYQ